MTLGRVPWSKAREYARVELGFEGRMVSHFWRVIYALDTEYHEWMRGEHGRHSKGAARKGRAPAAGGVRRPRSKGRRARR